MKIFKVIDCNNFVPLRKYPGKPREYCSDRCRDRENKGDIERRVYSEEYVLRKKRIRFSDFISQK